MDYYPLLSWGYLFIHHGFVFADFEVRMGYRLILLLACPFLMFHFSKTNLVYNLAAAPFWIEGDCSFRDLEIQYSSTYLWGIDLESV
jgi:hypothetical protein